MAMLRTGLDPANPAQRARFGHETVLRWARANSAQVRARFPHASLFYNAGHLGPGHVAMAPECPWSAIEFGRNGAISMIFIADSLPQNTTNHSSQHTISHVFTKIAEEPVLPAP